MSEHDRDDARTPAPIAMSHETPIGRLERWWHAGHREAVAKNLARNAHYAVKFARNLDPRDAFDLEERLYAFEVNSREPYPMDEELARIDGGPA